MDELNISELLKVLSDAIVETKEYIKGYPEGSTGYAFWARRLARYQEALQVVNDRILELQGR